MYASPGSRTGSRLWRFSLALWGTLVAFSAAADPNEAVRWLERVSAAARNLNYEGVFVYRHSGGLEAMRIIHRAGPDGDSERLVSLTGAPREIVRDKQRVTCILPDNRQVMVDRRLLSNPFSHAVPVDVANLRDSYQLVLADEERVAGRPAQKLAIAPRDKLRYGYRLWIDRETGLLLRSDLVTEQGQTVEQVMFTEVRMPAEIPPEAVQPQSTGEGFTWFQLQPGEPNPQNAQVRWQARELPVGFKTVLKDIQHVPASSGPVEHLLISDGLANVSVYIEPVGSKLAFAGRSRMGAVHVYGRIADSHQITVVGEVPAATVERIALTLQREP